MKLRKVKGFNDIYGNDIFFFDNIIKTINKIALKYNYKKVKLPTIENTKTLKVLLNENIDTNKNVYSFLDRNKNYLTLRPEFTSSITRFILSNNIFNRT
jgi:histidyl-tRNA synthetase